MSKISGADLQCHLVPVQRHRGCAVHDQQDTLADRGVRGRVGDGRPRSPGKDGLANLELGEEL